MNFRNFFRTLVAAFTFAAAVHASATPTLLVDNKSILTGAKNVDVAGTLYNVSFVDGTCNNLFNGCSASSFVFNSLQQASLAAQALLDQVFIDGPAGQFDSIPNTTSGCNVWYARYCFVQVPYQTYYNNNVIWYQAVDAGNYASNDTADSLAYSTGRQDLDFGTIADQTFAVFEPVPTSTDVPEPVSIALMSVALAGLGFARRRKHKN